jgi:phosphate transport system protein
MFTDERAGSPCADYPFHMRDIFHDELDAINETLLKMSGLVREALADATKALLGADLQLAEKVIAADQTIDDMQHDLDNRTINLMARQQPVASDLRNLVSTLRISADLERMGDLAHHVAKTARMRFPSCAVPEILTTILVDMDRAAAVIGEKLSTILQYKDVTRARELDKDDDAMDDLHRKLIATLLSDDWSYGIEAAIDMTLLGRYYERFGDHAVSIADRVYFTVTGEYAVKD